MKWNVKKKTVLVQDVELFRGSVLLQELARHLALGRQHDAVRRQYAQRSSGVRYRFQGILNLVQATFRREDGRLKLSAKKISIPCQFKNVS
jgi:hypothetical protein